EPARRAGHVPGARRRAPPLEPQLARGVAAHVGRGARRHRFHHGLRRARVRARDRSGREAVVVNLPAMDVEARAGRLRERFDAAGCDALLVSALVNTRYLTGFTGSAGLLLVLPDELVLVTDGRYRDQAAEQLGAAGVEGRVEVSPTVA